MKKMILKTLVATALFAGSILGQVGSAQAAAAAKPAAPIMRDNLAKYGLKKDMELPVTVTAGGLSYTLEKIMIFDTKSKDAQALIKKYGYNVNRKYFIWTKIVISNNSKEVVQFSSKDLSEKWRLHFGKDAITVMPQSNANIFNSPDALWAWKLEPGKKLSTYQALSYDEDFKTFMIMLDNKGGIAKQYIVKQQVE